MLHRSSSLSKRLRAGEMIAVHALLPGEAGVCLASVRLQPRALPSAPASGPGDAAAGPPRAVPAPDGGTAMACTEEEEQASARAADMERLSQDLRARVRKLQVEASKAEGMVPSALETRELPTALVATTFALERMQRAIALRREWERQAADYAAWCAAACGEALLGSTDVEALHAALAGRIRTAFLSVAARHGVASRALPALDGAWRALHAVKTAGKVVWTSLRARQAAVSQALAELPAAEADTVRAAARALQEALAAATLAADARDGPVMSVTRRRDLDELHDALRPGAGEVGRWAACQTPSRLRLARLMGAPMPVGMRPTGHTCPRFARSVKPLRLGTCWRLPTAELWAQLQKMPHHRRANTLPWGCRAASCWSWARARCRPAWTLCGHCRATPPCRPGAAACWCCARTAAACSWWPRSSCRTRCTLCACCGTL